MKAICVDDEKHTLKYIVTSCRNTDLFDEVYGFSSPQDAIDWVLENPVELALLDIDLPEITGLELAKKIREIDPDVFIIFLTAYKQYALDAFEVHPTGYLLKPVDQLSLTREIEYALSIKERRKMSQITARTFGHFEMLIGGNPMAFRRSKSKELLAYLIDRRGAGVTRQDAFSVLWEDRMYDVSMQKQMDVVIRSLRETLQKYGIDKIFELQNRNLRIHPEMIDCDMYRFLNGDREAVNAYYGEYMSQYTWAAETEARLSQVKNSRY